MVVIHMYGGCCICIYWWVQGNCNYSLSLKIAPLRFFVPKFKKFVWMLSKMTQVTQYSLKGNIVSESVEGE
jgi:hypothetical protein